MMSCAPTVPSPSPAPAPLFVNRGTHSMSAPRKTEQQLGLGLATGDLDYDPVVHSATRT